MEAPAATREKKKKSWVKVEVEGQVPEAPKLEDFENLAIDSSQHNDNETAAASSTLEASSASSAPEAEASSITTPSDSDALSRDRCNDANVDEVGKNAMEATEISVPETELLTDDSVPCEEALAIPSAPAPVVAPAYGELQQQNLYPCLAVDGTHAIAQERVPSTMISTLNSLTSFEIPLMDVLPSKLNSKIQHLYSNLFLESSAEKVKEFLKTTKTSYAGFELYELLCSYLRAFNQLSGCERSLSDLREKCTDLEKRLWTVNFDTLSQNSSCADGDIVVASHKVLVANFDKEVFNQLDRALKEIKELAKDSFSLYTYSVELCKTQISHFFHKSFKDINLQSFEVQGYYSGYPTSELQNCANLLKVCISTLFIFIRRPNIHVRVIRDCQKWLIDCVGMLLRIATLDDHLFILNHVIRCPPGMIAKTLASCVQIPKIPIPSTSEDYLTSGFGHLNLDYTLTVLSTILNPVPHRDEFLKQVEVGIRTVGSHHDSSCQWVVVDSDGEDVPEDLAFFKEVDLISLFHQIPFDNLFRRILLVYNEQGQDIYDIRFASERNVLKLLAFGTQLLNILGQGFVCYYTDRYRQLVKIIGRLVLHCVQYITDHIECLINNEIEREGCKKSEIIRTEYDLFVRNAVGILYSGKNIGTLQFLAAIPYHLISSEMQWHVYYAITKWVVNDPSQIDISSEFENELVSMNESDAFYLLTTLCNMAVAREKSDGNFIRIVTLHLFQIGFLSPLTRDCCSKMARDLLGNLTRKYPEIISVLLHTINSKMQVLDKLSLYLLKDMAFESWVPTELDTKLIFHWLVTFPSSAIESQTARCVIQAMNWGFNGLGELSLPFEIHYQIALMIMESNAKWEKGQNFISEGMKQMNALGIRQQETWAWDLLKRLHLHAFDRHSGGHSKLSEILNNMPTFESHSELECVRKGVGAKNPLACFLSLYLTPVGHSVPLICAKGFDLVEIMLQNTRLEFVIHVLFFITPLFIESIETLHSTDKFRSILTSLLTADMTYMRMAKNLITTDFPGEFTKLLGGMMSAQINQCSRFGTDEIGVIRLWVECLTKLDNWNKDQNILYLLNILAKSSLSRQDCGAYFQQYFTNMYKDTPLSSQSGIVSLFTWSSPVTTLLPNPSYSQTPYFLYYIFSIEMELETQSGFWKALCIKLNNPKISLDAAVKKSSNSTKFSTSSNFLTIYRWAQLGLDLSNGHELAFLVWQKFFLRYFHRVSDNQTTHYGCTAGRFFEGMINSAFHNKIRKKLNDSLNFCRQNLSSFESDNSSENASENPMLMKEFLTDRINLASALVLWIEDTTLMQPTLYLPALAPQFMPTVLLSLMDGEEISWTNYTDFEAILAEERNFARSYMSTISRTSWFDGYKLPRFSEARISVSSCVHDILKRFNSYDNAKEPPPVHVFEEVIPLGSEAMLYRVESMQQGLGYYFKHMQNFSKSFTMQISQMTSLNCTYLEGLPELYINTPAELVVNARCGRKSPTKNWHSCAGPARIIFKYTEAKLNENLGHQIHQNRTEYQTLMDEKGTQPPPSVICVGAVFIEDFITNLVMHYRRSPHDREQCDKLYTVGSELFYYAAKLVNDDTNFYPPSRQLLSSFMEVLGTEFISLLPNQCRRLVTTSIQNPKLIGSFAPHLNLAACQPSMLIKIYQEVSSIPKKHVDLAFVILTKFDINSWLKTSKPKLHERSQLLSIMWTALNTDELSPDDERLMVHDIYRNHLRNMLLYDFPEHYGEILALLLEGIDQNKVPNQIWYDFCSGLSRDTIRFSAGMDPFLRKREAKRFATEGSIVGHQELVETAHLLARHFTKERLLNGLYGLYSKYRSYIEPLSCFLQMISYSIVAYSLKNAKGTVSQNILDSVWPIIRDLYAPWMLPYNNKFMQKNCAQLVQHMNFDSSVILQPWIASDSHYAMIVVNDFTDCLMFLVETLPGNSTIFSYLWNFYVENFAITGVKEHIVGVVHNCFISIPWAMFWPTFVDVELMCKVVEKFLPASHSFMSIVFAQISWLNWIGSLSPKFLGKGYAMVLNLTVRLGNDSVARESPTWVHVMETAQTRINWLTVSPSNLEPILNWLVMSIDPRVVLNLEITHRMDKALLRLLETACGYGHSEALNTSCNLIELNTKRYYFIRSYVRLVVTASSKHKNILESQPKTFENAIQKMVSELAITVKREGQHTDFFISHLRELLNLMSNHTLGTIARNSMLEWCNSKDTHSLNFLLAIIQLSYSVKVLPYVTVPLIESCLSLCFNYADSTWPTICQLTVFNPEEVNNFFDISSKDGHYLVLYSLLLRQCTYLIRGGLDTICFFMDLLKNIKPKESNEEALPLVYGEMLKVVVAIHQETCSDGVNAGNEPISKNIKKLLLLFAQHLNIIGDDKQGWGLLGALGIGKASQLSVRGRLFSKCLAAFIFCQLPINSPVRINPCPDTHFTKLLSDSAIKPHPELQSCLEKLEGLKLNRQYSDLIECTDSALEFIRNPDNTLSSSDTLISKLNGYLFTARYLVQ